MEQNREAGGGKEKIPGNEARKWASLCHIVALVGLIGNGVGFVLGPLVVWLIKRDDDPFIDEQGKEAINFQITMFIAAIISGILTLVVIGFFMLVAVLLLMTVFPIIAAIKTSNGEHYRYPFTIRLLS
jgi:uncharacterized Tic20 family protein